MDRVGDAFVWPFRDPEWLNKILIMGLIQLIPFLGAINGLGWMLAALDRLRAGEERLPPANFDHLGRGLRLFVVYFVYISGLLLIGAGIGRLWTRCPLLRPLATFFVTYNVAFLSSRAPLFSWYFPPAKGP